MNGFLWNKPYFVSGSWLGHIALSFAKYLWLGCLVSGLICLLLSDLKYCFIHGDLTILVTSCARSLWLQRCRNTFLVLFWCLTPNAYIQNTLSSAQRPMIKCHLVKTLCLWMWTPCTLLNTFASHLYIFGLSDYPADQSFEIHLIWAVNTIKMLMLYNTFRKSVP